MPRKKTFSVMPEHALMGQMLKDHGFVQGKPNNNRGSSSFGTTTYRHYGKGDTVEIYHRDYDVPASKYGSGYRVGSAGQFTFRPSTGYNAMGTRVPRKSVKIMRDDEPTTSSPVPDPLPPDARMRAFLTPDDPEIHRWAAQATAPEPNVSGSGSEALRAALHKFGHRGKFESKDSAMQLRELDKSKGSAPKGPAGQPKPQGAPAGKGAPGGKGPAGKKPENGPPELPKTLNPADVHSYYMSMADFHDKKSWMNKRISGLKPLWSDDRTMHDDRHLFHKAMRDGFAQKALAVDLAAPMDGESGFPGMKESIQESASPKRTQVRHDVHTLEEFVEQYGESPLQALRSGRITRFSIVAEADDSKPTTDNRGLYHACRNCGWSGQKLNKSLTTCPNCKQSGLKTVNHAGKDEAFAGTAPTGALNTINNNKSDSAKPLPMKSPFPSNAPKPAAAKVPTVPKMPTMPKTTEATVRVANGENTTDVLASLLKS